MQANYGRSGAPVDVSFYLTNDPEEWSSFGLEKHQQPTKFKRDRNFPAKQERKWRTSTQMY